VSGRTVYLSLGSNVRPEEHIPACIQKLRDQFEVLSVSSIYETEPVGPAGPDKFWNAAAAIRTVLAPETLISCLRELEASLGRKRSADKFAPRSIDIDVLPQPGYQEQAFIMIPLAEIAAEAKDPETGQTFGKLAEFFAKEKKSYRRI
jgi:2-amino-4-hydroxy-6-hydroxymethyldihydropteridine diphosphokinase